MKFGFGIIPDIKIEYVWYTSKTDVNYSRVALNIQTVGFCISNYLCSYYQATLKGPKVPTSKTAYLLFFLSIKYRRKRQYYYRPSINACNSDINISKIVLKFI